MKQAQQALPKSLQTRSLQTRLFTEQRAEERAKKSGSPAGRTLPFRKKEPVLSGDEKRQVVDFVRFKLGLRGETLAYVDRVTERMTRLLRWQGRTFVLEFDDGLILVSQAIASSPRRRFASMVLWSAMKSRVRRQEPVIDATRDELARVMTEQLGFPGKVTGNDVSAFARPMIEHGIIERYRERSSSALLYRMRPVVVLEGQEPGRGFVYWRGGRESHDAWVRRILEEEAAGEPAAA